MLKTENIESAVQLNRSELFRFGIALMFIVGIMLFTIVRTDGGIDGILLVVAAMIGGYMAMNIGANDVANNVGPAVGSHAITLTGAIIIAASFEAGGALIAGGDVVGTIKSGIINPDLVADRDTFIWLMIAALLAAAVWLNFATAVGAPVSTTHSIVGGVLGAGIAAAGWGIADWAVVGPHCRQLGDFAPVWRTDCGRVPIFHQANDHLQTGRHVGGQPHGAGPRRCHGLGLWHLFDDEGRVESHQGRLPDRRLASEWWPRWWSTFCCALTSNADRTHGKQQGQRQRSVYNPAHLCGGAAELRSRGKRCRERGRSAGGDQ